MARRKSETADIAVIKPQIGAQGALEGADRLSRETVRWNPTMRHPDMAINPVKPMADARAEDSTRNDGYVQGAVHVFRDSIVGHSYRLNLNPSLAVLRRYSPAFDDAWAEEYQEAVEETFNLVADSANNWLDASRRLTLTGLIRLGVASWGMRGEITASAEWVREVDRPFSTAVQIISPDRLSNPNGQSDSARLRRGVERNAWGRPVVYHVRNSHPGELWVGADTWTWTAIRAEKPWGRKQFLHISENIAPDQTRGISDMVAVLKHMRMTKTYQDVMLQNAVVNATYAAAIESDLPTDIVSAMMGGSGSGQPADEFNRFVGNWLELLSQYLSGAGNIQLDGAKIPHLFPGTKLNMQTAGTPGGVGTEFEASLLRHIAAGLGLSYEELSHDYSKTNYSSARAALAQTQKAMNARKKFIADRFASDVFALWLEEQFDAGWIPLPRGVSAEFFYLPYVKDALTQGSWIGAGRGQIDEMKETQAAVLRIGAGLSTREQEIAQLGGDWRRVFRQLEREKRLAERLGLQFSNDATRPDQQSAGNTLRNSDGGNEDQQT